MEDEANLTRLLPKFGFRDTHLDHFTQILQFLLAERRAASSALFLSHLRSI